MAWKKTKTEYVRNVVKRSLQRVAVVEAKLGQRDERQLKYGKSDVLCELVEESGTMG